MVSKTVILNAIYDAVFGKESKNRDTVTKQWSNKLRGVGMDEYDRMESVLGVSLNMYDAKKRQLKHATNMRRPMHADLLVSGPDSVTAVVVSSGGKDDDDAFYDSLYKFGATPTHQFNV